MKNFLKIFIIFVGSLFFLEVDLYPGWFKHFGGISDDNGYSIYQNSDGTYIVAGETLSYTYGFHDLAIYKLSSSGSKIWFKHYGGTSSDSASSIMQTSDGNYIVAGYTGSFTHGGYDFAIYKLNSSGNKVWFKHYGGSNGDRGYSIQQTSDGGYIVAGYTASYTYGGTDFAIYKLDSSGNKIWFKHYGGTSNDSGYSIIQTSDGGYIVTGYTKSFSNGGKDFAIYKLDSNGNKQWFKHYGGTNYDTAQSIQQVSDGGYIVAGSTSSFSNGLEDFAVYKLNSNGNKVWFKHYGGVFTDLGHSIQQTTDGGFIVAGDTGSFSFGGKDFAIYKLDSNGNKTWYKHYGGTSSDGANDIRQTSEGGYIVAGYTYSYTYGNEDFAIYKLESNGDK